MTEKVTASQTRETPLRAEHEAAGAVFGKYFECLLPETFTDFASEYRYARDSAAVVDTNYHAIASFDGPDRIRYLNAVLSNDIKNLPVGEGCPALLLNPQAHILAELECYILPDRVLVLTHAMARERTFATLDQFIIMDDVTLSDVTNENGTIAIEGPKAAGIVRDVCGVSIEDMKAFGIVETKVGAEACWLLHRSHFGDTGAEFIVSRKALPMLWRKLAEAARARGGGPVGYAALNALRIEAGIPWFGYDFDDSVIPHEAALESTHISFSKGCYTGQEIVERVRSRGHVNRRRTGLEFSASTAPEHGTKLMQNEKEAGWVTSAAYSPRLARVIGMGYVRREQSAPGTILECATGGSATVANLPEGS